MKGRLVKIALALALVVGLITLRPSPRTTDSPHARTAETSAAMREGVLSRQTIAGLPPKPGAVRGVVMDWNLGDGVATLVAIDDGTVSLYMGESAGILGVGARPRVADAARRFLAEADRVRGDFGATTNGAIPGRDSVTFYVLTDTATLAAPSIGSSTSGSGAALGGLNEAAQALIAEIRKAS